MSTTLRVRFEDEIDPTYPDSWGWDDAETADYMEKIERGEYVVVMAMVEHLCEECGDWHDSHRAYLGDIHVEADDVLDVVSLDDIPCGPTWWGPERPTPANAATAWTPADNYLLEVAAELLAEATS